MSLLLQYWLLAVDELYQTPAAVKFLENSVDKQPTISSVLVNILSFDFRFRQSFETCKCFETYVKKNDSDVALEDCLLH